MGIGVGDKSRESRDGFSSATVVVMLVVVVGERALLDGDIVHGCDGW
jgi:hypothetical protein